MPDTAVEILHIAVGVIQNEQGEFLVSQRQPGKHLAGNWEFPGGKVEPGEQVEDALERELLEEIGVQVVQAESWLGVAHQYEEVQVFLDVWRVCQWQGEPSGCEGQNLRWVKATDMLQMSFPEGDKPIVAGCQEL